MTRMLSLLAAAALISSTFSTRPLLAQGKQANTVRSSTAVLQEIQAMPGRRIPQGMLAKAKAVAIIPNVIKVGFIVGGRHGSGVAVVRNANGTWGNPIFVSLTGGGIGFQAGVQSTDVILVFNSPESVAGMLNGKFTLGADAAVAAGPIGRQAAAATDIQLRAEILSYSRSRGLFAGVSLQGSVLSVDHNANAVFYHVVGGTPQAIIAGEGIPVPPEAAELKAMLAVQEGTAPAAAVAPVEMAAPVQAAPALAVGPAQPPIAAPAQVPVPAQGQSAVAARPPAQALAAAPATATNPDQIRRELATASQRLGARLDQRWRNYLALPSSVFTPGEAPTTSEALNRSLERFDKVGRDPQFHMVHEMPEFGETLGLLRKYHSALTQPTVPNGVSALPPPPTAETRAVPPDQSRY